MLSFAVFATSHSFTSCTGNATICNVDNTKRKKTIILYVIANNNLATHAKHLVNNLEKYLFNNSASLDSLNLLVFYNSPTESILLVNKNDHFETVNNYGRANSLSKDTMTAVLKDIENMFPTKECGIIFWSHGTGWLTAGNTRSFGDDGGEAIEICDMAEALVVCNI